MGKKASKATKKFATSGKLKKTIQARHKAQDIKKKIERRRGNKDKGKQKATNKDDDGEEGDKRPKGAKRMTVDSFLSGDFMDESDQDDDLGRENEEDDELDEGEVEDDVDSDDNASFASVDELDQEGQNHLLELSKLAEKDPEFFKYLQENDKELLEFDPDGLPDTALSEDEDEDENMEEEEEKVPVLTKQHLRSWQKPLLQQHSLRALRKLLIAFRSAAHMNEDGQVLAWSIDSSSVYSKLVNTALRYPPIVLEHHIPYKTLPNGKFKPPTQTPKFKALQKLILSHFHNITHILLQLTDEDMLRLALSESAKLIPYIISSRKSVKTYLKVKCLEIWSSAADGIRITAFLSIRRLAASADESILDTILKSTYLTLIRSSKSTSTYTLPSINLMKNSASDVFCVDHAAAYQHAFGYIRQLAIHLRNSMKVKTKEAYKNVYNWQFAHCVDFWCIVLGRACDANAEAAAGRESDLRPLVYPLVQVSLGAIKLVPNTRSNPFHLQILRSLCNLSSHTRTYIPISPYLIPILTASLQPSSKPKSSTLKPLDLETHIRIPQQYLKTRIMIEGIIEETSYLLTEWLASETVHGSIGFPELVVPVVVFLRKAIKTSSSTNSKSKGKSKPTVAMGSKEQASLKTLIERIEESAKWVDQKRSNVKFSPSKLGEVENWERDFSQKVATESPLGKYLKVQREKRERRKKLIDKAREGKDEILDQD
ncbi:Noc2p family-domain-containing protein [Crepidotus variabilis]|uniref:Noc2p family-domain-containing protein n=1 Tax=Crepidotus variabilis TaxID=179855 RepID=A0A9P6JR06_9AGAR|nr:Noc2p family-domain-containing protein [Crepidotus variabilis]